MQIALGATRFTPGDRKERSLVGSVSEPGEGDAVWKGKTEPAVWAGRLRRMVDQVVGDLVVVTLGVRFGLLRSLERVPPTCSYCVEFRP